MRFLALIALVFSVCMSSHARAEETTPAQDADVGARRVAPLHPPSNAKFNSVVSKTPPVLATTGQALTADGTGNSVWANVLGTALSSVPSSSGAVLQSDGNGGTNWNLILGLGNGGTGSATQNFVDLSTNQSIAGNKTFTGTITGNVVGNVTGSSSSFTGLVAGDVTGTQSATVVSSVGGVTAANVASGANAANAATTAPTPNTLVKRDGSGNTPGFIGTFADFFALMPGDNAATVAPGTAISFPQDGPLSNLSRVSASATQFILPNIGTYQVTFQVSVTEPGQLVVVLNGVELPYTVVGRATGTSQIAGTCLVSTAVVNSILEIHNPTGNSTALTITPLAGGTHSVSAHLVILQIK